MTIPANEQGRGHLAMLVFSALVAGSFSLGGLAAPLVDPGALTVIRFLIASAVVGTVAIFYGNIERAHFRAPWRYGVLGGLLAGYFVLMFEGLKTATPISTAAVFTLTPLITAGFGYLVLRQKLTSQMAVALFIGAAGAVWVVFRGDFQAMAELAIGRGEWLYFIGCVAHALYAPLVRKFNRGEPALSFTLLTLGAGAFLVLLWSWPAMRATDWASLPAIVWITIFYTALAASAASFVLMQYASLRLPAAKVMAYTYLTPIWVIFWEAGLGNALPPALTFAGFLPICFALWLLLDRIR